MELEYKKQTTDLLNYRLFEGKINVQPFKVIKSTQIELPNNKIIEIGILGSSHYIYFNQKNKFYTELLTCGVCSFLKKTILELEAEQLIQKKSNLNNLLTYTAEFVDLERGRDLIKNWPTNNLSYQFPGSNHVANTFLHYEIKNNFHFFSIHEYPEEKISFITQSIISL